MTTNRLYVVAKAIETKIRNSQTSLGIQQVFYGDQDKINTTPVVCVEPETKRSELYGAARVLNVQFNIAILVYHSKIGPGEDNRISSDTLAEDIEALIHLDPQLRSGAPVEDALVTHCMITDITSGYATKFNSLVRASRLSFEATTKGFILPQSS